MKRWGLIVTIFYALIVVFFLFPLGGILMEEGDEYREFLGFLFDASEFLEGGSLAERIRTNS